MYTKAEPWSVAVVGAGPWGTYAVERLAALMYADKLPRPFRLLVFEASGRFGCGRVHHDQQIESSQLNRVASQIAFAADETVSEVLLPLQLRPTMAEWAREKFVDTGDERYRLKATEIPSRALHGEALRDAFKRYVSVLENLPTVEVCLVTARVDRLVPRVDGRVGLCAGPQEWTANHVLLSTGHGADDLAPYPLRERLGEAIPAGTTIALDGMGLTSIDVILALTEGRGGSFTASSAPSGLTYHPSGDEPAHIFPFSRSGYFVSARPRNDKALDPSGRGHAVQQLTARHLTEQNIGAILARNSALNFRLHVEPLIIAEMTEAYYRALLGDEGSLALPDLQSRSEELCAHADSMEELYAVLDRLHDSYLIAVARPQSVGARHATALLAELPSHPDHGRAPLSSFVVDWRYQLKPQVIARSGTSHAKSVRARMLWDLACARQGNVRNPWKAAWDGVWRDLRGLVGATVDRERLTPQSRVYFNDLLRTYSREVNGAGDGAIAKLITLIDAGIVDLGQSTTAKDGFREERVAVQVGDTRVPVHRVVPGRVLRPVEILRRDPLYAQMVAEDRLEFGSAPDGGSPYLRLDQSFHPRNGSTSWHAVTILGVPTEGFVFFQLALARPHVPNAALVAVERWARGLAATASP